MKGAFVLIFLISIIFVISFVGFQRLDDNTQEGIFELTIVTIGETIKKDINVDQRSILDILDANFEITTTTAGAYKTLKCLDDVCGDSNFLWVFYVNEEVILNSIDRLYPRDGDKIKIKYGDIK